MGTPGVLVHGARNNDLNFFPFETSFHSGMLSLFCSEKCEILNRTYIRTCMCVCILHTPTHMVGVMKSCTL